MVGARVRVTMKARVSVNISVGSKQLQLAPALSHSPLPHFGITCNMKL